MKYKCLILEDKFKNIDDKLKKNLPLLLDNANVFILYSNEYDKDRCITNSFLDAIKLALDHGLQYVNTIIAPTNIKNRYDCIKYILWFSKNKQELLFDKDSIREKSIWKDLEWGKREKNYNPKGKDPGNVWIPTNDDGKGTITEHVLMDNAAVIKRLLNMSMADNKEAIIEQNKTETVLDLEISLPCKEVASKNIEHKVIFGTSEHMSKISNESVSLVVTSPPYWDLKNYYKKGQIGQEDYTLYLERMNAVWKECIRILNEDGSIWININIRVKDNCPILIPYDYICQLKNQGLYLKNILIWHKSSGIPTSKKNIVDRHEYVLVFTKNKTTKIHVGNYCDYKNQFMNNTNIWNINRKAGSVGKKYIHPAIYPNDLTNRIILNMTKDGDLVCDPFLGSGTTLISCINNNRSFIGYEYNEGFQELIETRIKSDTQSTTSVVFESDK